jgi:hypothetical protein
VYKKTILCIPLSKIEIINIRGKVINEVPGHI